MTSMVSVSQFVNLAALSRAGKVESVHQGVAAVTRPDGVIIDALGDATVSIFPRSAVKPLQVVAMRRAGMKLTGAKLAITAGSHQGTPEHIQLVLEILASVGLDDSALQCPVAWPASPEARKSASAETTLAFNCSGKHAGFLAACIESGWDTKSYLDPSHPLQVLVKQVLEEYSGEDIELSTVDGCGAPLHTITPAGLARAFGTLAKSEPEISAAMLNNAWAVGGQNSPDKIVMQEGIVAKLGAEGVFALGLASGPNAGAGVAVKIADGALRAAPLVAIKLLKKHQMISGASYSRLETALAVESMGGGHVLGHLTAL